MTLLQLFRLLRRHAQDKARIGREGMRHRIMREIVLREVRHRG